MGIKTVLGEQLREESRAGSCVSSAFRPVLQSRDYKYTMLLQILQRKSFLEECSGRSLGLGKSGAPAGTGPNGKYVFSDLKQTVSLYIVEWCHPCQHHNLGHFLHNHSEQREQSLPAMSVRLGPARAAV